LRGRLTAECHIRRAHQTKRCKEIRVSMTNDRSRSPSTEGAALKPSMLQGLRVIETADELGEYAGLLLEGLGAEVIKIEPAEGSPTRSIGPFFEDQPGTDFSLFFWAYNR